MMALLGLLLFKFPEKLLKLGKYEVVVLVCLFVSLIFYLLFLHKKKWKNYVIEFDHQEKKID